MVSQDEVTLTNDGAILLNGKEVGYLGWNNNVLVDILVEEEYGEQGIATIAVNEMVNRVVSEGYSKILTTTVVSPEMESVLQKVGFEDIVVEQPLVDEDDLLEIVDEIPTEESIEWVYKV